MVFGILGCVEVMGPLRRAEPLSGRHRALIAALALQPGVVVPYWRLVEALWGEDPPRTAVRSLHSHVARLRLVLEKAGLGGLLQTREPGYLLAVEPAMVDAGRFEGEVRKVRDALATGAIDGAAEALEKALGLWRGAALADAEPTGWTAAEVARLENLRSAAMADRCETLLALGRYGEALAEAERLVGEDPLRERLVGLHMVALWGCGQPAEAFAAYQRLRQGLADELGVDPSPELTRMHTMMLRGATAASLRPPGCVTGCVTTPVATTTRVEEARPAQLPAPVGYFTGRGRDIDALDEIATQPGVVALICGHGGIGKTSLAVQWAHQRSADFPDGQVFVDARGHDRATALNAGELAGLLLRCLGVPADRVPHGLDERIGMYRSLLAAKRMLIIIDNAGGTDQISPVLPGTATSLLLVTSRGDLAALVTLVEVRRIVLGMLTEDESTELFRKVLGAQRVEAEPPAVARLADLCGRMPLALRIAAAKLVTQPNRAIESFADEVSGEDRLAHLGVEDGMRTVEAVFFTAYQSLSPNAQRIFRRMGQHPGPHFSALLAGAMCPGLGGALDELVAAHLIYEPAAGRYRFHDLVRLFAQQRAEAAERREVGERLVDWYLTVAHAAAKILDSNHNRLTPAPGHPAPDPPFPPNTDAALAFLESERDNLHPIVRLAIESERSLKACQLTYLLGTFFAARGHWSERVDMCRPAVDAARRLGDPAVEAEMHRALGVAYRQTYRLNEALDCHLRALPLLRELGDERGLAYLYNNIGGAQVELRRFEEAVDAYRMALSLHTSTGNGFGAVSAQRNLGYVYIRMGEIDLSLAHLDQALASSRAIGFRRMEAATLICLGEAFLGDEQPDRALTCFTDALAVSRDIGDLRYEMHALFHLGLTSGKSLRAIDFFHQALELSRRAADRHSEARTLTHLGEVHLSLADHDTARQHLDASARLRESVPDVYEEARLRRGLGDLAHATGDRATAREHWEQAAALFQKANAPAEADLVTAAVTASGESASAG